MNSVIVFFIILYAGVFVYGFLSDIKIQVRIHKNKNFGYLKNVYLLDIVSLLGREFEKINFVKVINF